MMPINPGQLRHRITLSTIPRTPDGSGGFATGAPVAVATVWAAVNPLEGSERLEAMQTTANASHEVQMRYQDLAAAVPATLEPITGSVPVSMDPVTNVTTLNDTTFPALLVADGDGVTFATSGTPVGEVYRVEGGAFGLRLRSVPVLTLQQRRAMAAKLVVGHQGRTFDIVSPPIDPEERHETLILLCKERQ